MRPAALRYLHAVTEKVKLSVPPDASAEVEKAYEESITQNGFILSDPDVVAAMDHSGDHRFVPEYDQKKPASTFKSEEELEELFAETEKNLCDIVGAMKSGLVNATPGRENCRFCRMASVCRKGRESEDDAEDD